MSEVEDFLGRLDGVRGGNGQWTAKCPSHPDKAPSLSVSEGVDGKLIVKCHAGCDYSEVIAAADFVRAAPTSEPAHGVVVASYEYRDEKGDLLYVVERRSPKGFSQKRPDGNGGWVYRLSNVRRVPYRLPELLAGISENRVVFVVEGEKDVETLYRHGLVATTNSGGAAVEWDGAWIPWFAGARVCVIPDNDDQGRFAAAKRARLLALGGAAVRLVQLPDVPEKGDVTDWLEVYGHTVAELRELYMAAPLWGEGDAMASAGGLRLTRLSTVKRRTIEWMWPDRIPKGKLTLLAGDPGTGKSYVTLALAAAVTTGGHLPDGTALERGRVVMAAYEDDREDTIGPRFDGLGGDDTLMEILDGFVNEEGKREEFSIRHVPELVEAIKSLPDVRLVVIDPVMSFVGGKVDANRDNEVRAALMPLVRLAAEIGIAVVGVVHFNKGDAEKAFHRVGGSVAFTALARSVLLAAKDPDTGRRALVPIKANLGDDRAVPIEYEISDRGLLWVGEAPDLVAERLTAPRRRDTEEQVSAVEWLEQYLSEGPRPAKELREDAEGEGYSYGVIQHARRRLDKKIKTHRQGVSGGIGKGYWVWEWQELP